MKKFSVWIIIFLFFGNVLAWTAVWDLWSQKFLEVNFLDVGQGDAALIKTPGSLQILIDGGPDSAILEKLGNKIPFWDRSIDLIILSHPEKDHLAGLIEVLKRYKVENILWTGIVRDTAEYREWLRLIKEEEARIIIAQAGQKIKIGKLDVDILCPLESLDGQEQEDSNDSSVVVKLIYGANSFLFTGDISEKAENDLVQKLSDIDSDILKIAHHGSKYSSTDGFVGAVSPEIAVIEVGKDNGYGHPAQEVLDRLFNYDIDILRTDQNGDIKIISDSKNIIWQMQ